MRPQLITLALTTGTLASTNPAPRSAPAGTEDSSLQLRHESGLASPVATLERRTWARRDGCKYRLGRRRWLRMVRREDECEDGDDSNDDDSGAESGGKDNYSCWDDPRKCDQSSDDHSSISSTHNPKKTSTSTSTSTSSTSTSTSTTDSSTVASTTSIPAETSPPPAETHLSPPFITSDPSPWPSATSDIVYPPPISTPPPPPADGDGGTSKAGAGSVAGSVASGVVGGLLALSILCFLWYRLVIRPRRRDQLGQPRAEDGDEESRLAKDSRSRLHTPPGPRGPGSSSDGLSVYALPIAPGAPGRGHAPVDGAARSQSRPSTPGSARAGTYPTLPRGALASSSPAASNASFADAYGTPHAAYGQAYHAQSYSPAGSPQRPPLPPVFPPQAPPTMGLEGRPPPPRYPDVVATSEVARGVSPTSPLPVSPLSVSSRDDDGGSAPHMASVSPAAVVESQYPAQQQQYGKGPQQHPSYDDYAPSALPEVVSPICQLGQTSASPPEYDESAETARSGGAFQRRYEGEEKQVLQQSMARY